MDGLRNVGKIVNKLKDMEENKMFDYYVKYIINNIEKTTIVILDDFYSDFIEDFILDKLEDLEESRDIKILHIEPLRDYNVNVYNL